jgi:uncharacterized MAPEG superfamily protein
MPTVLYVLFVLSLLPYVMAVSAGVVRAKHFGRFDNNHPRLQQAELRGLGARLLGAQANSWEALIVFSVSVRIAHASGLPLDSLELPALMFLGFRIVYCAMYALDWAWVRSVMFFAGLGCCIYIFMLAASHARAVAA